METIKIALRKLPNLCILKIKKLIIPKVVNNPVIELLKTTAEVKKRAKNRFIKKIK